MSVKFVNSKGNLMNHKKDYMDKNELASFASRLSELMQENAINQAELAKMINVSQPTISTALNGKTKPSVHIFEKICKCFSVNMNWLVHGIGEKYNVSQDAEIELVMRIMEGQSETKKRLMRMVATMPDELIEQLIIYWKRTEQK